MAQFVVPRSMPMLNRGRAIGRVSADLLHPNLKFDLPAAIRSGVFHPELEVSQLGYDWIDDHRNRLAFGESFDGRQRYLDLGGFVKFALRIRYDLSRRVSASDLGCEETEIRGLPSD